MPGGEISGPDVEAGAPQSEAVDWSPCRRRDLGDPRERVRKRRVRGGHRRERLPRRPTLTRLSEATSITRSSEPARRRRPSELGPQQSAVHAVEQESRERPPAQFLVAPGDRTAIRDGHLRGGCPASGHRLRHGRHQPMVGKRCRLPGRSYRKRILTTSTTVPVSTTHLASPDLPWRSPLF